MDYRKCGDDDYDYYCGDESTRANTQQDDLCILSFYYRGEQRPCQWVINREDLDHLLLCCPKDSFAFSYPMDGVETLGQYLYKYQDTGLGEVEILDFAYDAFGAYSRFLDCTKSQMPLGEDIIFMLRDNSGSLSCALDIRQHDQYDSDPEDKTQSYADILAEMLHGQTGEELSDKELEALIEAKCPGISATLNFIASNRDLPLECAEKVFEDIKRSRTQRKSLLNNSLSQVGEVLSSLLEGEFSNVKQWGLSLSAKYKKSFGSTLVAADDFEQLLNLPDRLWITAPHGAGKTSILRYWFSRFLSEHDRADQCARFIPVLVSAELLSELRYSYKRHLGVTPLLLFECMRSFAFRDTIQPSDEAWQTLSAYKALLDLPLVLLIDEAGEPEYKDFNRMLRFVCEGESNRLNIARVVVVSTPNTRPRGQLYGFESYTVDPLKKSVTQSLLMEELPPHIYGGVLDGVNVTTPLMLRIVLEELSNAGSSSCKSEFWESVVEGLVRSGNRSLSPRDCGSEPTTAIPRELLQFYAFAFCVSQLSGIEFGNPIDSKRVRGFVRSHLPLECSEYLGCITSTMECGGIIYPTNKGWVFSYPIVKDLMAAQFIHRLLTGDGTLMEAVRTHILTKEHHNLIDSLVRCEQLGPLIVFLLEMCDSRVLLSVFLALKESRDYDDNLLDMVLGSKGGLLSQDNVILKKLKYLSIRSTLVTDPIPMLRTENFILPLLSRYHKGARDIPIHVGEYNNHCFDSIFVLPIISLFSDNLVLLEHAVFVMVRSAIGSNRCAILTSPECVQLLRRYYPYSDCWKKVHKEFKQTLPIEIWEVLNSLGSADASVLKPFLYDGNLSHRYIASKMISTDGSRLSETALFILRESKFSPARTDIPEEDMHMVRTILSYEGANSCDIVSGIRSLEDAMQEDGVLQVPLSPDNVHTEFCHEMRTSYPRWVSPQLFWENLGLTGPSDPRCESTISKMILRNRMSLSYGPEIVQCDKQWYHARAFASAHKYVQDAYYVHAYQLPERPAPFIGMRYEVNMLYDLLHLNSTVTLSGSAGVGKTYLACQYAHESLVSLTYSYVIWIFADKCVWPQLSTIRTALGMSGPFCAKTFCEELSQKFRKTLLVFDDVVKSKIVEEFARASKQSVHVLVVSQIRTIIEGNPPYILSGFSPEDACAYINHTFPRYTYDRTGEVVHFNPLTPCTPETILQIAREMCFNPLALFQAPTVFCATNPVEMKRCRLLDSNSEHPPEFQPLSCSVMRSVKTLRILEGSEPLRMLMGCIGVRDQDIPYQFFNTPPKEFERIATILESYCIITYNRVKRTITLSPFLSEILFRIWKTSGTHVSPLNAAMGAMIMGLTISRTPHSIYAEHAHALLQRPWLSASLTHLTPILHKTFAGYQERRETLDPRNPPEYGVSLTALALRGCPDLLESLHDGELTRTPFNLREALALSLVDPLCCHHEGVRIPQNVLQLTKSISDTHIAGDVLAHVMQSMFRSPLEAPRIEEYFPLFSSFKKNDYVLMCVAIAGMRLHSVDNHAFGRLLQFLVQNSESVAVPNLLFSAADEDAALSEFVGFVGSTDSSHNTGDKHDGRLFIPSPMMYSAKRLIESGRKQSISNLSLLYTPDDDEEEMPIFLKKPYENLKCPYDAEKLFDIAKAYHSLGYEKDHKTAAELTRTAMRFFENHSHPARSEECLRFSAKLREDAGSYEYSFKLLSRVPVPFDCDSIDKELLEVKHFCASGDLIRELATLSTLRKTLSHRYGPKDTATVERVRTMELISAYENVKIREPFVDKHALGQAESKLRRRLYNRKSGTYTPPPQYSDNEWKLLSGSFFDLRVVVQYVSVFRTDPQILSEKIRRYFSDPLSGGEKQWFECGEYALIVNKMLRERGFDIVSKALSESRPDISAEAARIHDALSRISGHKESLISHYMAKLERESNCKLASIDTSSVIHAASVSDKISQLVISSAELEHITQFGIAERFLSFIGKYCSWRLELLISTIRDSRRYGCAYHSPVLLILEQLLQPTVADQCERLIAIAKTQDTILEQIPPGNDRRIYSDTAIDALKLAENLAKTLDPFSHERMHLLLGIADLFQEFKKEKRSFKVLRSVLSEQLDDPAMHMSTLYNTLFQFSVCKAPWISMYFRKTLLETGVVVTRSLLGSDHFLSLRMESVLAITSATNCSELIQASKRLYPSVCKIVSERDPRVFIFQGNVGIKLLQLQRGDSTSRDVAQQLRGIYKHFDQNLKYTQDYYGKYDLNTASALMNLGSVAGLLGDWAKMMIYLEEAAQIFNSIPHDDDQIMLILYNNLLTCYAKYGKQEKIKACATRVRELEAIQEPLPTSAEILIGDKFINGCRPKLENLLCLLRSRERVD